METGEIVMNDGNWWDGLLSFGDDVATSVSGVMSSIFGGSGSQKQAQQLNDYTSSADVITGGLNSEIDKPVKAAGGVDLIKGALDFIKNKENAPVLTLGALFVKGALEAPQKKRMADAAVRSSEANMLTATSQDEKWRTQMANGSSIGKTNFGIMGTPAYKDLAAVRRQRSEGIM
jgi:hypothetical protein